AQGVLDGVLVKGPVGVVALPARLAAVALLEQSFEQLLIAGGGRADRAGRRRGRGGPIVQVGLYLAPDPLLRYRPTGATLRAGVVAVEADQLARRDLQPARELAHHRQRVLPDLAARQLAVEVADHLEPDRVPT